MLFKFAQELDKKFDLIRNTSTKKNFRSVDSNAEAQPRISIKAISEIKDRSNNNAEDLGRDIDELLEEMILPENIENYFKQKYKNIQVHYANIKYYTKEQIADEAARMRGNLDLEVDLVIALMNRANKIVTGYELRPAQILSVLEFFREKEENKFCQINTGEGKTTVTSAIAVIKSLQGETVDIITSNEVLAQDAIRARAEFYALFNLSVAHNNANPKYSKGIRDCYANDIVYGTIGNFEFDYLRHRVQLSNTKGDRKFGSLIIDEADNVVLDNATHVAKTSGPTAGMETLKYVYINIWQELIRVEQGLGLKDTDLTRITVENRKSIKEQISKAVIKSQSIVPQFLESYVDRKLDGWINNAIRARYDYHQNQHYIIDKKDVEQQNADAEESIIPLDVAVGVTQQNTVWTGLHPFVQIKHNLQITDDSLSSVFIANSEYIKLYNNISGLTGTLGSKEEREVIKALYKANSTIIPTYKAGQMEYETNLLVADDKWLKAIADDAINHAVNQGRAALIVCNTMQDVLEIKAQLIGINNINVITYMNEHDANKIEEINNGIGIEPGTIVIATNIGGRGTDIKLSNEVKENGGLHECTTFIASSRILKQALGRAGRQGEPGSARIIIKEQNVKELGLNLNNNFSNQDIYDLVDEINNEKILKFIPQIKRVENDGKYFTRFADLYTQGKSLELNQLILEDLKLQWALAFDERKDAKINEVFAKFKSVIEKNNIQDYEHQFINPYFAVNYADYILAVEPKDGKEEEINLSYDKAKRILNQSCVTSDPELIYVSNMKLFELTISLAQRNELKRLASSIEHSLEPNEEVEKYKKEYKEQAKGYLEDAQKALSKRIKYLEDMITSENFHNIILPQDALNNNKANYMLKHLESKYAALQIQLQHVNILSESVENSGDSFIYINTQHNLNELIEKIETQNLTDKICQQEIMQISNAGENSFSNLETLTGITENNPKVQASMYHVAAGFATSTLNLPSFTRITSSMYGGLVGSGIFDIMKVIFSPTSQQAEKKDHLFKSIAFDFTKVIESLKILHRVGKYVSEDIIQAASNNKFFTQLTSKVTEQFEIFEEKLASIKPKAIVKAPKTLAFNPNKALKGSNLTKEKDIEGVDAYFGKYTLDAIKTILKLRITDARIDKVKITNNNYLFIDKDNNNIQNLVAEISSFTDSTTLLVPLSLSNKHAVGMICFIEHNKNEDKNNLKIYYIDPENSQIPIELEQIFNFNQLNIEQLTTETQKYANCGPEIIENFMLYLTGERLSQAEAIPYHSLLVEQDLLQNNNHLTENKAKQIFLHELNNNNTNIIHSNITDYNQMIMDDTYQSIYKIFNALNVNSKQASVDTEAIEIMDIIGSNDVFYTEPELSLIGLPSDLVVDDIAY